MSRKLLFKDVKQYFEDRNCKLYETEYINSSTKMRYECDCGNEEVSYISFNNFQQGKRCKKCAIKRQADKRRLIFEDVKQYFEDRGCELYETEYIGSHTKMKYRCDCGNSDCKISFSSFKQGNRCKKCDTKKNSDKQRC